MSHTRSHRPGTHYYYMQKRETYLTGDQAENRDVDPDSELWGKILERREAHLKALRESSETTELDISQAPAVVRCADKHEDPGISQDNDGSGTAFLRSRIRQGAGAVVLLSPEVPSTELMPSMQEPTHPPYAQSA